MLLLKLSVKSPQTGVKRYDHPSEFVHRTDCVLYPALATAVVAGRVVEGEVPVVASPTVFAGEVLAG